jgi:hypothetical protein
VIRTSTRLLFALAITLLVSPAVFAQSEDPAVLKPAEPDFTLINLPTSLSLPRLKGDIRITHRFVRPLKCDTCPDGLVSDAFGIDNGALIGLEFRMGVIPNGQISVHRARTSKTIQFLGEYGFAKQTGSMPLEMAALVAIEGTDNFTDVYSPSVGLAITHLIGERAALHFDPIYVHNSNIESNIGDDNTLMLGFGARLQVIPTLYITGEVTPRVAGYKPGDAVIAFALEKRLGGHMFQLNFSNTNLATTMAEIAQGNTNAQSPSGSSQWYMGFNITRKFF